mmetsp:Transcript_26042/g.67086  ORF Transcript_26042/g.67086 Transcript_26042/m.67086 type:complete len:502 (-) Transcript_26042:330-1835(-)
MPKTRDLLQHQGVTAENWYIHTPICSPSRSELMTGRYFHNIKQVGTEKGYCSGMHVNYSLVNNHTFQRVLQEEAGYRVGMFGKYLNEMPKTVPPGFDAWLANNGGSYIAPQFQTQNIDGLPDGGWQGGVENYSTAVIGNVSIAWIKKVAKEQKPFFAFIAPKAAHEPFNPAPWHLDAWDPSWPDHEPRGENWNCSAESRQHHHGNIPSQPMLTEKAAGVITGVFKNRWRTLMSVDDVISEVIRTVDELGLTDNTYFMYSSDHGFQLGQFNIIMDKRHAYEWDTRIHLLARGPGIRVNSTFAAPGTQVDIAPTILGLAGIEKPAGMDGKSIVPFLVNPKDPAVSEATQRHLANLGDPEAYGARWRTGVFHEYYFCDFNDKCVQDCPAGQYPKSDSYCGDLENNAECWCPGGSMCYRTEDQHNNFIALRSLANGTNTLYTEYQTGDLADGDILFDKVDFVEYFDVAADPWQMRNLANSSEAAVVGDLHRELRRWYECAGDACP